MKQIRTIICLFLIASLPKADGGCFYLWRSTELQSQAKKSERLRTLIEIIEPSLRIIDNALRELRPARDAAELQTQLAAVFSTEKNFQTFLGASKAISKRLARVHKKFDPHGFGIKNFRQVSDNFYRSWNPTVPQVLKLKKNRVVDHVVSLNFENSIVRFDPNPGIPLTDARAAIIERNMKKENPKWNTEGIRKVIEVYRGKVEYAASVRKGVHENFGLQHPASGTHGYFLALKRILKLGKSGSSVLFHCNVGKHRTGIMAMLIQIVLNRGELPPQLLWKLYVEFIAANWETRAATDIKYMLTVPFIVRSKPFQKIVAEYHEASQKVLVK